MRLRADHSAVVAESPGTVMARALNSLPHTGISREPCGPVSPDQRPSITSHINSCGNLPPWRCAMVVRSEGGLTKNECTGPSPLPDAPWQLAQLSL